MTIELEQLIGEHTLSGAYFDAITEPDYCGNPETVQVLRFTLDGEHYEAVEGPDDGYRSYLKELRKTEKPPKNTFFPVSVIAAMRGGTEAGFDDIILQFINTENGKCVMEFGTSNASDYYPGFVAEFHPENL